MVDVHEADALRLTATRERHEAGHELSLVVSALDEAMNRFAVGANARDHHFALLVHQRFGLGDGLRAALDGETESFSGIVHPKRDVLHAIAVFVDVRRDVTVRPERSRQDQPDFALGQYVAGTVACSGFRSTIRDDPVAEDAAVKLRRLLGITDIELYKIRSVDRKGVSDLFRCRKCRGSHDFSGFGGCVVLGFFGYSEPLGGWC